MSIEKIIELNKPNFDFWNKQLDEHFFAQYHPNDINKEEYERVFFQTNELLMDIASCFFAYGKFKNKWDTSKCHLNYLVQNLFLKSEKMNLTLDWGLDGNDFYMDAYIMFPENLRYMTDDFRQCY